MKNQKGFSIVEVIMVILVVGLIAAVGWLVYDRQKSSNQTPNVQVTEGTKSYEGQKVTSGLGRLSVEIPQGWNEVLRPADSDWLLIKGTKQPMYSAGKQVTVTDLPSYGSDAPLVFAVLIDKNIADPQGTASEFTLPNDSQPIKGTKYSHTYTADSQDAVVGYKKGEKRYEYWFKLKDGNNLVVWYSVYANDLNDQSSIVDEIVRTITVKN